MCGVALLADTFAPSGGCSTGYILMQGDVYGAGSISGSTTKEASCGACADLCTADTKCGSYECRGNGAECNLNRESEPNAPQDKDQLFCVKGVPLRGLCSAALCTPHRHFPQ